MGNYVGNIDTIFCAIWMRSDWGWANESVSVNCCVSYSVGGTDGSCCDTISRSLLCSKVTSLVGVKG